MEKNVHGNPDIVNGGKNAAAGSCSSAAGQVPPAIGAQVDRFLASLRARKQSPATVDSRRNALARFVRFLAAAGAGQLQDLTVEFYERYRLDLLRRRFSLYTVESYLTAVRLLYDWLEERALVFENATRFGRIRTHRPGLPQVISVEEVRRLLNAPDCSRPLGLRNRAMLEVLYGAAVRREELVRLTVFDVDLQEKTLRALGKGRKERLLPLGTAAARYLEQYLQTARPKLLDPANSPTDALWLGRCHKPFGIHGVSQIVERYGREAAIGKPVSPHTLRRSCATHMLANGAHPLMVAKLLGHADLSTLSHYLRTSVADLIKMHRKSKPGR